MVIGECNKDHDQEVNITRAKQLTNIRTHEHDEKIVLIPARQFSVEEAVSYIRGKKKKEKKRKEKANLNKNIKLSIFLDDELVEVTPKEIRIRKRELEPGMRRKLNKEAKSKLQ